MRGRARGRIIARALQSDGAMARGSKYTECMRTKRVRRRGGERICCVCRVANLFGNHVPCARASARAVATCPTRCECWLSARSLVHVILAPVIVNNRHTYARPQQRPCDEVLLAPPPLREVFVCSLPNNTHMHTYTHTHTHVVGVCVVFAVVVRKLTRHVLWWRARVHRPPARRLHLRKDFLHHTCAQREKNKKHPTPRERHTNAALSILATTLCTLFPIAHLPRDARERILHTRDAGANSETANRM